MCIDINTEHGGQMGEKNRADGVKGETRWTLITLVDTRAHIRRLVVSGCARYRSYFIETVTRKTRGWQCFCLAHRCGRTRPVRVHGHRWPIYVRTSSTFADRYVAPFSRTFARGGGENTRVVYFQTPFLRFLKKITRSQFPASPTSAASIL